MRQLSAEAITHLSEAVAALGRGDAAAARAEVSAAVAAERGLGAVADAFAYAVASLEVDGEVSAAAWDILADASPSEVRAVIERWRR